MVALQRPHELATTKTEGPTILELTQKTFPSIDWIRENLKNKSTAIRYLYFEYKPDVKAIARHLNLPYRHVYNVIRKAKQTQIPDHVCPVCMNRKPRSKGDR